MAQSGVSFDIEFNTPVKPRPPSSLSPSKSSVLSANRGLHTVPKSPRENLPVVGKIHIYKIGFSLFNGASIENMIGVYAKVSIVGCDYGVRTEVKDNSASTIEFNSVESLNLTTSSVTSTIEVTLWKRFANSVDILVATGIVELQWAIRKPHEPIDISTIVSDNGKQIANAVLTVQFSPKPSEESPSTTTSPQKLSARPYSAFSASLWKLTLTSMEAKDLYDTGNKAIKQSPAVSIKIGTQSLITCRAVDAGTHASFTETMIFYVEKHQYASGLEMEVEVSHLTSRDRKLYEIGQGKISLHALFQSGQSEQSIIVPLVYSKKNQSIGCVLMKGKLESVEKRSGSKFDAMVVPKDLTLEKTQHLESIVLSLSKDSHAMSEQLNHLTDDVVILRGFQDEMNKLLKEQGALLRQLMQH